MRASSIERVEAGLAVTATGIVANSRSTDATMAVAFSWRQKRRGYDPRMFTAISKRSDTVWLVTEDELVEGELPATARVLDLEQGKLFPPFNTHSILARGAPRATDREFRRRIFLTALRCVEDLGVGGLTVLPGMPWPHDPHAGWRCAVDELRWRVERAGERNIELRVEPHLASIVSTPELVAALVEEVPGLRLTLDASHFVCQSITTDRIVPLAPLAGHAHVRSAKPGGIQVHWRQNTTDFAALFRALDGAAYEGCLCVEYVPMEKWRCDELDVVTETVVTHVELAALLPR